MYLKGDSLVDSSFINVKLADELYLYMVLKLVGNGASLFMDETRNFIAESESLCLVDVKKIGGDIRIHAEFLKED